MLSPDDRSALITALRPPAGMVLGQAVATTFTLDLETAMSIPLAFAQNRNEEVRDPLTVMEALRDFRDRIDIFCQAGAIRAPATQSTLFAFLEPMITQVWERSRLFHPKVWLLRYDGPADSRMRLLVLTRNLTADRAWDLMVSLDGVVDPARPRDGSLPDLIRWARTHTIGPGLGAERTRRLKRLVEDAAQTAWEAPENAAQVTLHALGVGRRSTLELAGTRALVVSPFVQPEGLGLVEADDRFLVSRPEELDRLDPAVRSQFDSCVLDDAARLSEGSQDSQLTGLHAKAYVIEVGHRVRTTIGSPNATGPGLRGDSHANVEFAVTLEGSKKDSGIDRWLSKDGLGRLLIPYDPQSAVPSDETSDALPSVLRSLAGVPFSARAVQQEDGWSELVWPEDPVPRPLSASLGVELLTTRGRRQPLTGRGGEPISFESLTAAEVTPFLIVTVEQDGVSASTCVRATMEADVPDRLDHVLMRQVDTAEKFLHWLLMLFGDDPGADLALPTGNDRRGDSWLASAAESGLFEAMVISLADSPEQLQLVERFVSRAHETPAGQQVLPHGFLELWGVVRRALRGLPT